jgi:hypothetical protein
MFRSYATSSLTVALALGFATTAYAATGHFNNMCTMGLANHQKIQTDCSVNAVINGKTYCFGSNEAKGLFMQSPDANMAKARKFAMDDCGANNGLWNEEGESCIARGGG